MLSDPSMLDQKRSWNLDNSIFFAPYFGFFSEFMALFVFFDQRPCYASAKLAKCKQGVDKMSLSSKGEGFECVFCRSVHLTFRFKSHLREHLHQKHSYCFDCKQTFPDRNGIISHLADKHGQKTSCQFCSYKCNRMFMLENHMERRHSAFTE